METLPNARANKKRKKRKKSPLCPPGVSPGQLSPTSTIGRWPVEIDEQITGSVQVRLDLDMEDGRVKLFPALEGHKLHL